MKEKSKSDSRHSKPLHQKIAQSSFNSLLAGALGSAVMFASMSMTSNQASKTLDIMASLAGSAVGFVVSFTLWFFTELLTELSMMQRLSPKTGSAGFQYVLLLVFVMVLSVSLPAMTVITACVTMHILHLLDVEEIDDLDKYAPIMTMAAGYLIMTPPILLALHNSNQTYNITRLFSGDLHGGSIALMLNVFFALHIFFAAFISTLALRSSSKYKSAKNGEERNAIQNEK